jgi:adenylate cyclase
LIQHRGRIYASLALATFKKSLGQTSAEIEEDQNGPLIRVGSHHIPIDRTGFALMRFNGGASLYPSISALDILNGSYRGADLHGKMVFIGSSAVAQGDLLNTAFGPLFPGLKLQALMVEDMATDQFLRAPRWAPAAIWGACILSGALMAALFSTASGARTVLLGSGAAAVVPVVIAMALFGFLGIFVSPAAPFFNAALLSILFSAARFATERKRAILWFKRLENARQVAIESMAAVAETRDPETGAHIKRTQHYVKAIAEQLRQSGQYTGILTQEYIQLLFISAPLHDIGKVGVPDHILLKPARLTADEFEIMKLHAEFGRKIICSTASLIEGDNFLTIAGEIAATHHEKWDGTGYPLGLSGQDIPLSGRIMAVADIYDALISRRCYKEPFPHDVATGLMRKARGVNFDPAVLDAFFSIEEQIKQIAAMYRDEESAPIVEGLWPALERPVARPSLA